MPMPGSNKTEIPVAEKLLGKYRKSGSDEFSVSEEIEQYVTFLIGNEIYGVSILKVQEIIGHVQITHVPETLPFIKGVINLRGAVVPVIDMRVKFGMDKREYDSTTVFIIIEVKDRLVGMIVDSVSDVVDIPISSIKDASHFRSRIESDFIECVGQMENRLVIILNVERILSFDEAKQLNKQLETKSDNTLNTVRENNDKE